MVYFKAMQKITPMDVSVSGTIDQKTYLKNLEGDLVPSAPPGSAYEHTVVQYCITFLQKIAEVSFVLFLRQLNLAHALNFVGEFSTMGYTQGCHTVLISKICPYYEGAIVENIIVLISKKCTYFGLASLFYLIFSNNVL